MASRQVIRQMTRQLQAQTERNLRKIEEPRVRYMPFRDRSIYNARVAAEIRRHQSDPNWSGRRYALLGWGEEDPNAS